MHSLGADRTAVALLEQRKGKVTVYDAPHSIVLCLRRTMMNSTPAIAMSRRLRKTPFTSRVLQQGVKAFTVYNHMLLATEFDSLEADYWHLCSAVQVWDVSVERQISISGPDATRLVQWMTPRAIADVSCDRCVYLPLADERGKLINDPVGIRLAEDHWWLSIADSDVHLWAKGLACGAKLDVTVEEADVWPLAIQGPKAEQLMIRVFGEAVRQIRFFRYARLSYAGREFVVSRSGWSKQGGFEVYVDDVDVGQQLYDELFGEGQDLDVRPGCPNLIERMEGGLLSYGNDIDGRCSVLECGFEPFISLDAEVDSLSMQALRNERDAGVKRRVRGLIVQSDSRGIHGLDVEHELGDVLVLQGDTGNQLGSQVYSPRYDVQLATAVLVEPLASALQCPVVMADGTVAQARICDLPFDFAAL